MVGTRDVSAQLDQRLEALDLVVDGGVVMGEHLLVHAADAAHHGIVVVSDSDVRLPRDYLQAIAAPFDDAAVACTCTIYRAVEAETIRKALRATGGNRTHAAKLLEISHRALLYKIKEYGLRDCEA